MDTEWWHFVLESHRPNGDGGGYDRGAFYRDWQLGHDLLGINNRITAAATALLFLVIPVVIVRVLEQVLLLMSGTLTLRCWSQFVHGRMKVVDRDQVGWRVRKVLILGTLDDYRLDSAEA